MRHADAQPGGPDLERPLTRRGQQEARAMGAWLRQQAWLPDRVVMSPAIRCRQTVEHVLAAAGADPDVEVVERLYQGAATVYTDALQGAQGTTLLLGHLPTIEDVVRALAPEARRDASGSLMTTGAAACFEDGQLVVLKQPRP